jgi:moderate conductance mechanosensitive channel
VIRVRLKTVPLKQWPVGREFNRRMKKAFDANGIEMPAANQTHYLPDGELAGTAAPPRDRSR